MSNTKLSGQDKKDIEKFIKFLALKSTNVIVQARLGEKIRTASNPHTTGDWFNIAIEDQPDVLTETRKALQLGNNDSLANRLPLCVEISLQTVEGDRMILEVWSLSILVDQCDPTLRATYAIYNRMGILLKSLISVTRVTPAYKLSRRQSADSYHIYYRIYSGQPQEHNLGDGYKQWRVGQLCTPLGTLNMAVAYRTKMTISPTTLGRENPLMSVTNTQHHYFQDPSPKHNRYNNYASRKSEKKVIDIDKPMRLGAFVDVSRAKQYTEDDFSLPETPPFSWLLRNKRDEAGVGSAENLASSPSDENSASLLNTMTPTAAAHLSQPSTNNNNANTKSLENSKAGAAAASSVPASSANIAIANATSSPKGSTEQLVGTSPSSVGDFRRSSSRWSGRTLPGSEDEKLLKELHFPFATQNTPISDLAKFYRECFNAPPLHQFSELDADASSSLEVGGSSSEGEAAAVPVGSAGSRRIASIDDLTQQLERFETSLNDYDTLVTSLCQQSNEVDSNSNS